MVAAGRRCCPRLLLLLRGAALHAVTAVGLLALAASAARPEIARAASASSYAVESIRLLTGAGGRLDWSSDGQWIYYDRREPDGYFDLFRIRPDGSGSECLTCGRTDLPTKHKGNPTVHPAGRFVVFQAEKQTHAPPPAGTTTIPGGGAFNDLWIMDVVSPARPVWRLTNVSAEVFSGSLHPHFSADGRMLLWTDFEAAGGVFFDGRLATADLAYTTRPVLANVQYYNPGPQPVFMESHGWGPTGAWVYFACTPLAGMADENMDICRMDLGSPNEVSRMTFSAGLNGEPAAWDEHAHLSPARDAFSWMSSRGYGTVPGTLYRDWLKTELWLQRTAPGAPPQRLTFFNDPGHPEYLGERVVVADHAWSPDGREIAVYLQFFQSNRHEIRIVRFAQAA